MCERIVWWRYAAGLTQADVARAIQKSPAAVAQWELGETAPTHENLQKFAELAIGISVSEFWELPVVDTAQFAEAA